MWLVLPENMVLHGQILFHCREHFYCRFGSWPLYWSNEDGWVPFFGCDRYTHEEAMESDLPLDSKWMSCMTAYQFTAVDGAYVTTEVTSLLDDPNLEIGNLQEIDPT